MARRVAGLPAIAGCAVAGWERRATVYVTGPGDGITLPGRIHRFGRRVQGYVIQEEEGPVFVPHPDYVKYLK